jgi:hypothetical protein
MKTSMITFALRLGCGALLLAAVPALADDAATPQKSLDPAMAAFLVQSGGGRLVIPQLKVLSPEIADILCQFPGDLLLDNVTEIDEAVAASLARHTCESWRACVRWIRGNVRPPALTLNGVKDLSDDAAAALAEHPGRIELRGLRKLASLPLATKLANHAPSTNDTNPGVRAWKEDKYLDALMFHAEQAQMDKLFFLPGNPLHLDNVASLVPTVVSELARHRGLLSLNGLKTLSDESAAALGRHMGGLLLDGLTVLSNAAAEELAGSDGRLSLSGVTSLTDEQLEFMSAHEGELQLDGIRSLSDHQAAILAKHTGSISLGGVTEASPMVLTAILNKPKAVDAWIRLDGLHSLPDELAGVLGGCGCSVSLCGVRTISPATAASLAASSGAIRLNGITEMPSEIAQCFSGKDNALELNGLQKMPVELADALADHRGSLSLDGVQSLSRDVAMALSNHEGPLSLAGISTIDDDVAVALFRSETPIALAGLKDLKEAGAKALATHFNSVAGGYNKRRRGTALSEQLKAYPELRPALLELGESRGRVRERSEAECPDGPAALTPALAASLAAYDGPLTLNHVTTLDAAAARQLAKHRGKLSLKGLRTLDDDTASALGDHRGRLELAGVYTLSEKASLALCRHKDVSGKSRLLSGVPSERALRRATDDDWDLQLPSIVYVVTERAANALENRTGLEFVEKSFEELPTGQRQRMVAPGFGF